MKQMVQVKTATVNYPTEMQLATPCLICDKPIPIGSVADAGTKICQDCKDAVRFARVMLKSAREMGGDAECRW